MHKDHLHDTHPAIIARLKRVAGHLRVTIAMLESGRSCLELAQQLAAIEKAIHGAKKTLIHDHIDHCLHHAEHGDTAADENPLEEFKQITKYL